LESKLSVEFGALSSGVGVPVLARSPTGESKSDMDGNISVASRDPSTAALLSAKPPLFRDMSYSSIPDNDLDSEFGSPILRPYSEWIGFQELASLCPPVLLWLRVYVFCCTCSCEARGDSVELCRRCRWCHHVQ
jgi:hypothetical protein